MQHLARVVAQWRSGGYYDGVLSRGAELDRVKEFLRACAGERPGACANPIQRPHYPCFPGLRHRTWHDPSDYEEVRILERHASAIREEAVHLRDDSRVDYTAAATMPRTWKRPWTLLRKPQSKAWTVYLLYHMGVDVEPVSGDCPTTLEVVRSLPRACLDYTWGDHAFSAMNPGVHLPGHCSIDNLRVRVHLGLVVPEGCTIRVATEMRTWQEGKCLVFEDSFEHEVWNRSTERRIVLIVDLWHPDLTPVEVRALTAAFRKSEVRRIFMGERIGITDSSHRYVPYIEAQLASQDREDVVREFWPA